MVWFKKKKKKKKVKQYTGSHAKHQVVKAGSAPINHRGTDASLAVSKSYFHRPLSVKAATQRDTTESLAFVRHFS